MPYTATGDLLGFMALSLWILIPLGLLILGIIATMLITRGMKTGGKKPGESLPDQPYASAKGPLRIAERSKRQSSAWSARLVIGLIVVLIPTWDEIVGRLYFHQLCATESGVKVHKQMELPAEYWGANGVPMAPIVKVDPSHYETQIGDRFYLETKSQKGYSKTFSIDREHTYIRDRKEDAVLSELTLFRYWGGWLVHFTSPHISAETCPGSGIYADFYRATFVKS